MLGRIGSGTNFTRGGKKNETHSWLFRRKTGAELEGETQSHGERKKSHLL